MIDYNKYLGMNIKVIVFKKHEYINYEGILTDCYKHSIVINSTDRHRKDSRIFIPNKIISQIIKIKEEKTI